MNTATLLSATLLALQFPLAASAGQEDALRLVPESPREFQPVSVEFDRYYCHRVAGVEQVDGHLRVLLGELPCILPPPGENLTEVSLGHLPAGEWQVDLIAPDGALLANASFDVRRSALEIDPEFSDQPSGARVDISGSWWNPARPGFGVFIEHSTDGRAFIVVNDHDTNGRPSFEVADVAIGNAARRFPLSGDLLRVTRVEGVLLYEAVGTALIDTTATGILQLDLHRDDQPTEKIELQRIGF